MINHAYRVQNGTEKSQNRKQKFTKQMKESSEQSHSSQTDSMKMLADTKDRMETFMSQLQENIQQGSSQSIRISRMPPSRGKTVVCYGSQQTGHYLRECLQKVSRPFGSHFCCLTANLLLSHWYPGSGVVLDCIDS